MKKVNGKYILSVLAILFAISAILGFGIAYLCGATALVFAGKWFTGFIFIGLLFFYFTTGAAIIDRIVEKTMEKNSELANFHDYATFYSSGAIIRIEKSTGRIAYVSNMNPFQFQQISAKDITDIKSDYIKGPLGGTSYVYFEFGYLDKKVRIPTFTSNNAYSLNSSEVLEGISKADKYAEILQNAQVSAS